MQAGSRLQADDCRDGRIPGVSQRILGSRVTAALCTRGAKRPASMQAGNHSASAVAPEWLGTRLRRSKPGALRGPIGRLVASPRRRPHRPLSVHCLNPPVSAPNSWNASVRSRAPGNANLQAFLPPRCPQIYCLPCRRSRVRIPSAALERPQHLQDFSVCTVE